MLGGDVDVSKEPLQRMPAMYGVATCGMEQDVHGSHRFPYASGDGQPGLGDFPAWVLISIASSLPSPADGVQNVGAGSTDDSFSLSHCALSGRAIPQKGRRHGRPGLSRQLQERVHCSTSHA